MKRIGLAGLACALLAVFMGGPAAGRTAEGRTAEQPERVVLISLPGIAWSDIRDGDLPNITSLMRSIGAMSARTAGRAPDIPRGYLTLGAGNPAFAPQEYLDAHLAFETDARFEGGTAAEAVQRRTGRRPVGEVVHASVPSLQTFQDNRFYGSKVGSLGEALRRARVTRAVVSAADIAVDPDADELRRPAVLALMDAAGDVDHGKLDGLLERSPSAPFGVQTSPNAFARAARDAMNDAQVILLDPGETSRADEYARYVAADRVALLRARALKRADVIVGRLRSVVTPRDLVLVLSPTGPTAPGFQEHLGLLAAWGRDPDGGIYGDNWLYSATTRRQGMAVLSDVAPTVLESFGVRKPSEMIGTPIRSGELRRAGNRPTGSVAVLTELDLASSVRERFAAGAFWVISILVSLLGMLAFVVFLGRRRGRVHRLLVAVAYFSLAVFPAAHIVRAFEFWWLGVLGAHLVLYGVAAALAVAAWFLPGPRWSGGVALMILTVLLYASDVAVGGPLQLNGVFGHSPLVAGRFYGLSNPGYAILFAAALLGVTGLAQSRGHHRLPGWGVLALVVLLPLIGLAPMGADFGGLLAGIPAVGVAIALGRGARIRWRTVLGLGLLAVAVAVGLSFLDLLRPVQSRTHLGRFAELLVGGDASELLTVLERKGAASLHSLTVTRWTYFIPVGIAVLVLLLLRPRGILREVLPGRPLLRAGLWGTLVAGVLGFAVNDSGISIPALALAFTVPFLVLMAVDAVEPRKPLPP